MIRDFEGQFGSVPPGPREAALVRWTASLVIAAERLEAAILRGERLDTSEVVRVSNALSRCLSQLGLKKAGGKPRPLSLREQLMGAQRD